jgi:hypothetical protein
MPFEKKLKVVQVSSNVTRAQLEKWEREQPRRKDRPKSLALSEINVADRVFQWRGEDLLRRGEHVLTLARAIAVHKKPLDPILLIPVGKKFYVVDGHHRVEAYHTAKWRGRVPVEYFDGALKQARRLALQRNVKDKLPMSREEKAEAAWRMMLEDLDASERQGEGVGSFWTREEISAASTVSLRTVSSMRAIARQYPEARKGTWREARTLNWRADDDTNRDWREEKARKVAEQIGKNVGHWLKDPEITARALEIVSPSLVDGLIDQWRPQVFEAVQLWAEEYAEEVRQPELAVKFDAALRALFDADHPSMFEL